MQFIQNCRTKPYKIQAKHQKDFCLFIKTKLLEDILCWKIWAVNSVTKVMIYLQPALFDFQTKYSNYGQIKKIGLSNSWIGNEKSWGQSS